ncbi:MAG: type I-E CRISPR-associated endoribonuclease Cas2 [Dehalococcoidia bacterium]|nr:MAG: type I-E CRISPR-associated endoribonuclease Cas2 [Dehalococcoidia bacterium]
MVLLLERVPVRLRGKLTRWLLEVRAGVFVGRPPAVVREKLWQLAVRDAGRGSIVMIHQSDTEQGYRIQTWGDPTRRIVEKDGLYLVQRRRAPPKG